VTANAASRMRHVAQDGFGSQAAELAPGCKLPVCPCETTCSDTPATEAMGH
jgi:hypothetical protein